MVVSDITAGKIQDYRIHRMKNGMSRVDQLRKAKMLREKARKIRASKAASARHPASGDRLPPPNSQGREPAWLVESTAQSLRSFSGSGKVSHRAWFSPEEYKQLYTATRARVAKPQHSPMALAFRTAARLRNLHGRTPDCVPTRR